jgi:hypothetical protein
MRYKRSSLDLISAAFICAAIPLTSSAQKESTERGSSRRESPNVTQITLTKAQQDWVKINYQKLASLRKESATALAREQFRNASDATLEAMISQASKLMKTDTAANIAELQQQLERLKAERQNLLNQITRKEAELAAAIGLANKARVTKELEQLQASLRQVNLAIQEKVDAIRKLQGGQ